MQIVTRIGFFFLNKTIFLDGMERSKSVKVDKQKKCAEHIQLNFSITFHERVIYKMSLVVFTVNL